VGRAPGRIRCSSIGNVELHASILNSLVSFPTQGVSTHGIPIPSYGQLTGVQTILLELEGWDYSREGSEPDPGGLWTPSILLCFGNMILHYQQVKDGLVPPHRIFPMQLAKSRT